MPARRYRSIADLPRTLPVFPLTGALLLPRARLPLNIFEPRYLAMVDYAMDGGRLIGMIQPRIPGEDMAQRPDLALVGCAGRIVEYSETEDGRYLITLLGIQRFSVQSQEDATQPFRLLDVDYTRFPADMENASDPPPPPIARDRLLKALKPYLRERDMKTDWKSLEEAPAEALINALAMLCPFEPGEKQALLEAPDLTVRTETLIALIEIANAATPATGSGQPN